MLVIPKTVRLDVAIPEAHQKVFTTLLRVNAEKGLNTTLRVAGGWIRDMLLGLYSNDIDIAIESHSSTLISGERFASEVSAFEAVESGQARTVGVIRVNPALSKHIETATVCVCGIPVEFCALRADEYCENSRIPQVRPATPLGDALRRDFTINALFYNLNTNMVEDYTTGLEDLRERIIRCPLSPRETFHDDPLRLLRGVRFIGQLGKLNFCLHSSILECVDDELLDKLCQKVSRERVGKEFTKMMTAPLPERCVEVLFEMRLLQKYLLAEVYMKQLPGKKKFSSEIERIEYLLEKESDGQVSLAIVVELNTIVSPLFSNPSSLLFVEERERLMAMMFELIIPFYRGATPLDVEKRLYALCINGLKLPLHTFHCIQGMVNCYNVLRSHRLSITDLQQCVVQDSTKLIIFEALGHLNNASVISNAFNIVLYTFLILEEHMNLLHATGEPEGIMDFYIPLWRRIKAQQGLLDAYRLQLPVKGSDLRTIEGIKTSDIGALLMDIRKKVVLNSSITREEIIDWLKGVGASNPKD
ncbi:unnamed protein product [Phytomonas sp. EM1]|nr:unnamed protein product [Phytomonas sp. EM1]|eukprot:CCW64797.1 unnamed protein product [Phytomonas sp. isolate EM1]